MLNDIFTVILIAAIFFIGSFFVARPAFAAPAPTVTSISPSSGTIAGGTSVTIAGTGFLTGPTVTIGGNAATNVNRLSSLQITATTPAGTAGAQDVTVTNTDTKSGTLTAGFTYVAPTPDTTAPVIILLGITPVNLNVGDTYSDAGATASDNIDGDITANIVIVNPVNIAVVGTYTITYNVSDAAGNPATQVTRTVNVLTVIDTTPPVITLTGAAEVTLTVGGAYTELGATAVDAVDGSVAVQITGSVDTAVVGDYTITYTATDAASNTATATRILHVVAASPTPDTPAPTPAPSGGGSGGGTPITVTFSGQAYPGCAIEVLRKSAQDALFQIIPTESASIKEDGIFEISHTGLMREEYLYALRLKDKDGRKTTLSFDVNLLVQSKFTLTNILAPPTVEVKNTLLLRAEDLQLIGYAAPSNTIEVEIDGSAQKGTALAAQTGYYTFAASVGPLAVGAHYARVRQVAQDGKKSDWSQTKSFKKSLLLALKTDFNSDEKVNIIDWSVFLFRWGSQDTKLRSTVDLDGNGKVDVIDLSIFLKTIQI